MKSNHQTDRLTFCVSRYATRRLMYPAQLTTYNVFVAWKRWSSHTTQRQFGIIRSLFQLLLLSCASFTAYAQNQLEPLSLVPPGSRISFPREFFGMHIHEAEKPGRWPTEPFGAWRLWDTRTTWARLEPKRGFWDFSKLDSYVDIAGRSGIPVLLCLGMTPRWASARPDEPSAYEPGQAAEPANLEDWRNYVRKVAERYRSRIEAYEVWNEANIKVFWSGNISTLVEMTRIAREEIKRADPHAKLLAPSGDRLPDSGFFSAEFVQAGGGSMVDVLGMHLYNPAKPPEAMVVPLLEIRKRLQKVGASDLPIWNTEQGYYVNNLKPADVLKTDRWVKLRLEPTQAADYMLRSFLIARALGIERYYWYAWDNRWLGLIEPGDLSPKAPAKAYGHAVTYLLRSTLERCDRSSDGVWRCRLTMANGQPAEAVWMDPSAPVQQKSVASSIQGKLVRFDGVSSVESPTTGTILAGSGVTLAIRTPLPVK